MIDIYRLLSDPHSRELVVTALMEDSDDNETVSYLIKALSEDHYIFPLSPEQTNLINSVIGIVIERAFQSATRRFGDNYQPREDREINRLSASAANEIPDAEELSHGSDMSLRFLAGAHDESWEQHLKSAFEERPNVHDLDSLSSMLLSRILDLKGYTITGPYLDFLFDKNPVFTATHTTVEELDELMTYLDISFSDSIRVLLKYGQHRLADRLTFYADYAEAGNAIKEKYLHPLTQVSAYLTSTVKLSGVREMLVWNIIAAFDDHFGARKKFKDNLIAYIKAAAEFTDRMNLYLPPLLDPSEEEWLDRATSFGEYLIGYAERRIRGSGSGGESGAAPQGTPPLPSTPAPAGGGTAPVSGTAPASADEITAADYEITAARDDESYNYDAPIDDETGEIDSDVDVDATADDSWTMGAAVYVETAPPVAVF